MPTDSGKGSFIVYADMERQIERLSDAQAGQLFRGMFLYNRGEEPAFADPTVGLAFDFIRPIMDVNRAKWDDIREKRRQAGRMGGRPRKDSSDPQTEKQMVSQKANGFFGKQTKAKKAVTVTENVTENVTVTDTVSVTEKEGRWRAAVSLFGERISGNVPAELGGWCELLGEETVCRAITEADRRGKRSWGYVQGVLHNWQREGVPQAQKPAKRRAMGPGPAEPRREPTQEELEAEARASAERARAIEALIEQADAGEPPGSAEPEDDQTDTAEPEAFPDCREERLRRHLGFAGT